MIKNIIKTILPKKNVSKKPIGRLIKTRDPYTYVFLPYHKDRFKDDKKKYVQVDKDFDINDYRFKDDSWSGL